MTNSLTPVWLLDFNGVINVDRKGRWPRVWNSVAGVHYFRWAPELVRQIHEIHRSGAVEILWATDMVNQLDIIEKSLGLPSFQRAFTTCAPGGLAAKHKAAREVLNSKRRLIWTDDQVIPKWGSFYNEMMAGNNVLISPVSVVGLQPEDIQVIKNTMFTVE